jgi:hypothetical protein
MFPTRRGVYILSRVRVSLDTPSLTRQSQWTIRSKYHCNCSTHKAFSVFGRRFLVTDFNTVILTVSQNSKSKSKSHYDWRSVSKSWCRAPSGTHDQIFITVWLLQSCFCGAPSLTRGQVCLFYMLLALPAQSFSGPSPFGLAIIFYSLRLEFSFRRLLRLAESRWRYSTSPPHGLRRTTWIQQHEPHSRYIAPGRTS